MKYFFVHYRLSWWQRSEPSRLFEFSPWKMEAARSSKYYTASQPRRWLQSSPPWKPQF